MLEKTVRGASLVALGALLALPGCGGNGAAGTSCWDLNANNTCDPAMEDLNTDGNCNVTDCRGPAGMNGTPGTAGTAGDDGMDGTDGAVGTACWDLNADGMCALADPGIEDADGSGACNSLDCAGGPGDPGLACWDLNGNGMCDAAAEDVDLSTTCTAADCAGVSVGSLTGVVTNSLSTLPVAGVAVAITPAAGVTITATDAAGVYTGDDLPVGAYMLTFTLAGYTTQTIPVGVVAGIETTRNVALVPTSALSVNAGTDQTVAPATAVTLTATPTILNGGTAVYAWTQTGGPTVTITGADMATATLTTPTLADIRTALFTHLNYSNGTGGAINRTQVQAIDPFALEEAHIATFQVTVTTTVGTTVTTATDTVNVTTTVPWVASLGIQNVPIGVPVLLHAATAATYAWVLTKPAASAAAVALDDVAIQNPTFTPDVVGLYTAAVGGVTLRIFAGTWSGGITGLDATTGRPTTSCVDTCHGTAASSGGVVQQFVDWSNSGHAEIFTVNLNTSTHYGEGCFACHTVGYNTAAANNGIDDQSTFAAFIASDLTHVPRATNFATALSTYGNTAALSNIQCENCHGPNAATGASAANRVHNNTVVGDLERTSVASGVCGTCHGEPARHGRFQQWMNSGHSNMATAIAEGARNECGVCHSAQGFIYASARATATQSMSDFGVRPPTPDPTIYRTCTATADCASLGATWTCITNVCRPPSACATAADCPRGMACAAISTTDTRLECKPTAATVEPQTCVACHDPHAQGTTSGEPNTSTVRIDGNTPMLDAGFRAFGAGRGALCLMCHNSRRGAAGTPQRNDSSNLHRMPHAGPQGNVLMGETYYFIPAGTRGGHSYLEDTCATCHMEATPPPAEYSYNRSGTNHEFAATVEICADCHGDLDGEGVVASLEAQNAALGDEIGAAIMRTLNTAGAFSIGTVYSSTAPAGLLPQVTTTTPWTLVTGTTTIAATSTLRVSSAPTFNTVTNPVTGVTLVSSGTTVEITFRDPMTQTVWTTTDRTGTGTVTSRTWRFALMLITPASPLTATACQANVNNAQLVCNPDEYCQPAGSTGAAVGVCANRVFANDSAVIYALWNWNLNRLGGVVHNPRAVSMSVYAAMEALAP